MRKNWRLEPILQFKLETIKANVQQIGDDEKPCGPLTYSEDIVFDIDNMQDYWHDAVYWYKQAVLHNEPLAIKMLQCIADFKSTEQKAMAGDTEAQYLLSVYYEDGYGIFIKNLSLLSGTLKLHIQMESRKEHWFWRLMCSVTPF